MDGVLTHGAGREVPKKRRTAGRIVPAPTGQDGEGVADLQTFGTLTIAWLAVVDWLTAAGMTHVALERTGDDGQPVSNRLAGALTVGFVQATQVQHVPGRQTAKAAARWLATRRRSGVLPASFIPPEGQRAWRDVTRYRTTLGQARAREGTRVPGVWERAPSKRASVASALRGVAGRAMLDALRAGRAAPPTMAAWAKRRLRRTSPLLAQALTGLGRAQHRRW
jgi:hypothetical protein